MKQVYKRPAELHWSDPDLFTEVHVRSLIPSAAVESGSFGNSHKSNQMVVAGWLRSISLAQTIRQSGIEKGYYVGLDEELGIFYLRTSNILGDYLALEVRGISRESLIVALQDNEQRLRIEDRIRTSLALENFARNQTLAQLERLEQQVKGQHELISSYRKAYEKKFDLAKKYDGQVDRVIEMYCDRVKQNMLNVAEWAVKERSYQQVVEKIGRYAVVTIIITVLFNIAVIWLPRLKL